MNWGWQHDTGSGNSQHNHWPGSEEVVGIGETCRQINWLIKLMLCAGRLR
ncbi:hypothetical protein ACVXHA_17600 [Escherichia coli]